FAEIAAPIHKVTNKTKKTKHDFHWHDEQQQAFEKFKQILTTYPLFLQFPDATAPFILAADASDIGISGILRQETPKGTKINYYKSRSLSDTEKRYDTIEKEALAIYWCITDLRQYIGDLYVSIETDHKPLTNFHKKDINNKRVMNGLFKLQDIIPQIREIKHILRDKNTGPDYLSKHPTSSPCVEITLEGDEEHWPRGTEAWEIKPPRINSFTAQINAVITRQEAKRRQPLPESLSRHITTATSPTSATSTSSISLS
ncbi:unnamed protein product, partial [Didymodactylos carnosus]